MFRKEKIIVLIIILAILLIPNPLRLKDGGSVEYKAILYTVTKIHQLPPEGRGAYIEGFEIEILGKSIYRETNE